MQNPFTVLPNQGEASSGPWPYSFRSSHIVDQPATASHHHSYLCIEPQDLLHSAGELILAAAAAAAVAAASEESRKRLHLVSQGLLGKR